MKNFFLLAVILIIPSFVFAHPMGNFSINHYSAITPQQWGVRIDYIIDMAEIPTFQEMASLDTDQDKQISAKEANHYAARKGEEFGRNLLLSLNQNFLRLVMKESSLKIVTGAAGLPTLVLRCAYFVALPQLPEKNTFEFRDENFPDRLGWKEIVLRNGNSLSAFSRNASFMDRSKQLTHYPADPTVSAPQETDVSFQISEMNRGGRGERILFNVPSTRSSRDDRFTKLISTTDLTGRVLILSLLIAFVLGAMHAMSPGHGKTIVAGYLVGSRGTALHAVFLGAVVTLTHTSGVFFLGFITLYGSRYILPERLYPWLGFASGISIVIIGITLFRNRLRAIRHQQSHAHDHHHHRHHEEEHEHEHEHEEDHHGHSHLPVDANSGAITWRSLLTVGISGGALPCPSALVV